MKANEFVKENGWDEAKKHLNDIREAVNQVPLKHSLEDFSMDLKRLVESYEFVVANGGLDGAKEYCDLHDPNRRSKHYNSLRNKIADVESCQ